MPATLPPLAAPPGLVTNRPRVDQGPTRVTQESRVIPVRRALILAGAGLLIVVLASTILVTLGVHRIAYRYLLLASVAQRVTAGAPSTEAAVEQLHDFVFVNVRAPSGLPSVDDSAADELIRGAGYCDQADLVFIRLVRELGVPAELRFLRNETGKSPHTVALVLLDGEWRVFDTFYGFIPRRPDGTIATVADVLQNPSLLGPSRAPAAWYERIQQPPALKPEPWQERIPRQAAGGIVRALPGWAMAVVQDAYLQLPQAQYALPGFFEADGAPDTALYLRARQYQVLQRTTEASAAYEAFLRQFPESQYVDDVLYTKGLLELEDVGDAAAANATLTTLLARFPATGWQEHAYFLLAKAREQVGDCATAEAKYREIAASPSDAREGAAQRLAGRVCA